MTSKLTAVILAAGQGTRMKSPKPKVLHAAAGRPLIDHVIGELKAAGVGPIRLVVGYGEKEIRSHLKNESGIEFFSQKKQLGTADAVKSAGYETLEGPVLICNGDHPLIKSEDYKKAMDVFLNLDCDLLVVSCEVKNPFGFGRIQRSQKGRIVGIVEEKDASPDERHIREINSGLYVVKSEILKEFLPRIKNNNSKGEYYLTDLVALTLGQGLKVEVCLQSARVVRGVNTQSELALASKALFRRKAQSLMDSGVTIIDPFATYVDCDVAIGAGTTVFPGVMISGKTEIGENCTIEAYCGIKDSLLSSQVQVRWGTLIENAKVGPRCILGPYARLRPESVLGAEVHIGNFVELKKTKVGDRTKANHLTYLGDAEIGEDTNIGCGTITCNYAVNKKKYQTKIGNNVFVGSDTQFVAPIEIGDGAVIGSGSTITKDVPKNALAVARGKQFIKPDYNKGS